MAKLPIRYADRNLLKTSLAASASLIAVCGFLAVPAIAHAQDNPVTSAIDDPRDPQTTVPDGDPAPAGDEIVVTGIRASLANAQTIKRDSDTVVDAITATDIGALPDRSVTEALQRVPGVAINRFAAANNPDRFSVEGSGVVIRGLSFVRSEFNGRDAFSAGGGQSLGFSDVPAELLGSVIVAKNLTAEMIEGGLAGTVNLNTRVPFDNRGFHYGGTAEMNYSDYAKRASPNASFLVSNTWDTDAGTFGLLASVSYSQVIGRADGIRVQNFQTRDGATVAGSNASGPVVRTRLPGKDVAYAPLGGGFISQSFDRERTGIAAAAQWESPDKRALATLQYTRSETSNDQGDYELAAGSDIAEYNTFPAAGTNYTYDSNNVFQKGYISFPGSGYRAADSGTATTVIPSGGLQQTNARRQIYGETKNEDLGFNLRFNPVERIAINVDAQYAKASANNFDFTIFTSNFADHQLDLTGKSPVVNPTIPQVLRADWAAPNTLDGLTSEQYFKDPRFTFWRAAMDHFEESEGTEYAFRGDLQYSFDDGSFIKRAKVGARYADRDSTIRNSAYNWGNLSEIWGGNTGTAVFLNEFGRDQASFYNFPNFFRGKSPAPIGGYFYNGDLRKAYNGASNFAVAVNDYFRFGQPGPADPTPNDPNTGLNAGWRPLATRAGVIEGTPYIEGEVQDISQRDLAGYVMVSFGNDQYADGDVKISGNLGVRYVDTRIRSNGAIQFPTQQQSGVGSSYAATCLNLVPTDRNGDGVPEPVEVPAVCDLGPTVFAQIQTFSNGATERQNATNNYGYVLPALNLKLEVTPKLQFRVAASRAITRPEFNLIRNVLNPTQGFGGAGYSLAVNSAPNPFLKPAQADQFDLSVEWYFARVGSVTFTGFYKSVKDFFYQAASTRNLTSNGVTFPIQIVGAANYSDERGQVKGFEASYQQTFDFLPGFLSGLGTNLNYTFIESKGVPNSVLDTTGVPTVTEGNLPLEQLSKHNFNATVFYEKGPISIRTSYNWRSRFLLTSRDVVFPFYPIYNAPAGYLDGTIFVNLTRNLKLSVQATNLLNTVTRTEQQFTTDGLLGPRTDFINDRRFSFGARYNF